MDNNMTMIGNWNPPNPSPRTFMSNFLNEEFSSNSLSGVVAENRNGESFPEMEKQKVSMNFKEEEGDNGFDFSSSNTLESCLVDGLKSSSRGGLAQRKAMAGFNAPTINTARIRSANMVSSPSEVRSPYLTIPPGLSPTTLLDSPVFLCNSMAQPSPTTGKISFASNGTALSISASDFAIQDKSSEDEHHEDFVPGSFAFKPPVTATSSYFPSPENKSASGINCEQSVQSIEVSLHQDNSSDRKNSFPRLSDSFIANENSLPTNDQSEGEGEGEGDAKGDISSMAVSAPAEDGYNWRKYGQKQVKGSEFPRSYYKCTHPNCPVKKKVERSHEGHITEIIYKGAHNHVKPMLHRRSGVASSHPFNDPQMDGLEHQANFNGIEATSSATTATEFGSGPLNSVQIQNVSHFGSPETIDVSSTVSDDEEEEEQATHASVSLGGDGGEGDESESKRRKLDAGAVEISSASRAVREPRVVVQTTSEVDILDDGYRWRKYGQKVVKGNPNPRSYYKCTSPGCTVRKHVERASHDLKSVITTYEGKHNHDVPAARNSSHSNSAPSTAPPLPPAQRRSDQPTAQNALMRFNGQAPLTTFNLPGRAEQVGMGSAYSFSLGQAGLANHGIDGFGSMGQAEMPILSTIHSYLGMQSSTFEAGFMVPKGEPKEEPASESNGMTAYHQLMGRLPLGHQM